MYPVRTFCSQMHPAPPEWGKSGTLRPWFPRCLGNSHDGPLATSPKTRCALVTARDVTFLQPHSKDRAMFIDGETGWGSGILVQVLTANRRGRPGGCSRPSRPHWVASCGHMSKAPRSPVSRLGSPTSSSVGGVPGCRCLPALPAPLRLSSDPVSQPRCPPWC